MKSYFWGIFLISSGLVLIAKYYLNWNIPTGRVLIGLFLVSLGLSILIGGFGVKDSNNVIFNEGRLTTASSDRDYNIVFGQGTLDLTDVPADQLEKRIDVSTVFAATEVILPKDLSVSIKADSAFASTEFPDGSQLTFGDRSWQSDPEKKGSADLEIKMSTVFGRTVIKQR
jgi:predicted membrane protein